jgi:hypothetical protein
MSSTGTMAARDLPDLSKTYLHSPEGAPPFPCADSNGNIMHAKQLVQEIHVCRQAGSHAYVQNAPDVTICKQLDTALSGQSSPRDIGLQPRMVNVARTV